MRANKAQIIKGVVSYAENELVPKMWDRSAQFIAATALNLVKTNNSLADPIFEHPLVKRVLVTDENGMCDIDALFGAMEETFRQYREFPVPLPSLGKNENTFTFRVDDLDEIKRRIGVACGYGQEERP